MAVMRSERLSAGAVRRCNRSRGVRWQWTSARLSALRQRTHSKYRRSTGIQPISNDDDDNDHDSGL